MSQVAPVGEQPLSPEQVAQRLSVVRRRIEEAGGDPQSVKVVAVTKGFSVTAVSAALEAGVGDIGENYADELLDKARELAGPDSAATGERVALVPTWHYLGAIQRRRVKDLAGVVGVWQTVSRVEEGRSIVERTGGAKVMVEVETTGLPGRNGCSPQGVGALVGALGDLGLEVTGLMTIAPPATRTGARTAFGITAALARDLGLRELSMGMSDDLEIAVEQGATMVRIGRAIFGERAPRRRPS